MRIFASPADHITNHTYKVLVPPSHNALTQHELNGDIAPMFAIHEMNTDLLTQSRQTIYSLVEMILTKTMFQIVDDYDLVEIMYVNEAYINEMRETVKRDTKAADFVRGVIAFRQAMYRSYFRAVKRHPDWLEAFSSANISNTHAMLAIISGNAGATSDGVGMLPRDPPYELPKEKVVPSQTPVPSIPLGKHNPFMYGR